MSTQDYKKANYDQILFRVKKGKREEYQQVAKLLGMGFWALIQNGVEEYIKNHAGEMPPSMPKPELTSEQKRLVEEFNQLPLNAQKHFLQAFKAINQSKGGGDND